MPSIEPHGVLIEKHEPASVREAWERFRAIVLTAHPGLHPAQLHDLRSTFYQGCDAMFALIMVQSGPDEEPDEIGMQRLDALYEELTGWRAEMLALGLSQRQN